MEIPEDIENLIEYYKVSFETCKKYKKCIEEIKEINYETEEYKHYQIAINIFTHSSRRDDVGYILIKSDSSEMIEAYNHTYDKTISIYDLYHGRRKIVLFDNK